LAVRMRHLRAFSHPSRRGLNDAGVMSKEGHWANGELEARP
jgi:hypothetical protein